MNGRNAKRGRIGRYGGALLLVVAGGLAIFVWRSGPLLRSATASVSHGLCAAAFVSGLDPEQVFREEQLPMGGMSKLAAVLRYRVDRERREVRATIAGAFGSRAVFREGYGCHLVHGDAPAAEFAPPATTTPAIGPDLVEAIDPRLAPALDEAFREPDARGLRQTKAIVVLHDGRVIAERYAPGYTVDTPIWAHSLTKSVTSALIGILVRDGRLSVDQPAPIAAWSAADDPHHGITIDQLLRMDAGFAFDETDEALSPATRMFMLESDTAAFAARQPLAAKPGLQWGYSNMSYALLSRVVRDVGGEGDPAKTRAFIEHRLFAPLGLRHATFEFDAAGTPNGAGFMLAPARDWARFGQLYLDDGVVDGQRILPEGWARYSATQSLPSTGYGAGFWTNRKTDGEIPYWGIEWGLSGLPADTYFARGFLGQFVVIVPSEKLVVVRMGLSHDTSAGLSRLAASIIETLKKPSETFR